LNPERPASTGNGKPLPNGAGWFRAQPLSTGTPVGLPPDALSPGWR